MPAAQPLRPARRAQTVIFRRRTFDCPHARREDRSCPPRWRAGHPLQGQQHNHQGQQTAHSHACCIGAYARTLAQHDNRIHRPHWRAGHSLVQQRSHQRPASRTQTMLTALAPSLSPMPLQLSAPVPMRHHAATHHVGEEKNYPGQGQCSYYSLQHTNFKPHWRRISTRQLTEALPKTRPVPMLHLAAHQPQSRAPIQCHATPLQLK